MASHLATANLFLGIIALTTALEAIVFVGLCVFAVVVLRRAARAVERLDAQHITPALGKVNAILDDAKCVSSRIHDGTGHAESLARAAVNMVQTVFEKRSGGGASKLHDHVM
jgi:membrane protein implicated in regulation of membrane protease activity